MPSLVIPPASQIFGNSQRASARPERPTDSAYQTDAPNSPRSRGAAAAPAGTFRLSDSTSGAERPSRHIRTNAAATCSAPNRSSSACAIPASSPTAASSTGCSNSRRSSFSVTSSAEGALPHSAVTLAPCNNRCAFLNSAGTTISAETPLRPARPVRPERCSSTSELEGRSAWITNSNPGRSIPRAATSVAMQTRARPSRNACKAWVRSCCDNSPESATT